MPNRSEVDAKHETLARGLARGLSATEAGIAAGYGSGGSQACKLAQHPDIQARVATLRDLYRWTGSFEPAPLVMELLESAREARALASGAGMSAAAQMYAELGRLTTRLATRPAFAPDHDPMTEEEWLDAFGPPS